LNFIGTTDNLPLIFRSNRNEIFRISSSDYYRHSTLGKMSVTNTGSDNDNVFAAYSGNTMTNNYNQGFRHYFTVCHRLFKDTPIEYTLLDSYEWNFTSGYGRGKHMIIQGSEANLGIGWFNTPPTEKLSVNGNSFVNGNIMWGATQNRLSTNQGGSLELGAGNFISGTGTPYIDFHFAGLAQDFNTRIINDADGRLTIQASHLHAAGNLGIGCTNVPSGFRMAVNGAIRARRVRVDTEGWCDYVFDENYKLKPLQEVEEFIKKNKHLEEIPSAEEVSKEGIDLSEMNMLLLKKVEEITLYLIELKNENELLKGRVQILETKN
jgi:hypothetical protein